MVRSVIREREDREKEIKNEEIKRKAENEI